MIMAVKELKCSVDDCHQSQCAKGLCRKHYWRARKYGDPLVIKKAPNGECQDYYHNVVVNYEGDDCLPWPYALNDDGYPLLYKGGKNVIVSRFLCAETYGPPPTDDHQAAHSCGNGHLACVNKKHLRWATFEENIQDRIIHGSRGGKPHPRLSSSQIENIVSLKSVEPQYVTARRYGLPPKKISLIQRAK